MASINQTGSGIRLPNFCNLGVMLRSLVAANLFVMAFAAARSASWAAFANEMLGMAAFAEPVLFVSLALLCGLRPALQRMPYGAGIAMLAVLVLGVAGAMYAVGGWLLLGTQEMPAVQVAVLTLFAIGCVVAYFDLRSRGLEPAVAEARIQALQARIRPHFLYNSINAVLSLIRSEPRRAERALEDLADLFRVLMAENRTLAPLENEIGLVRQYLALESLRLGERLRVVWRTDTMPADALVPPLVLQPLVENAVYHGIEPCTEGGEICIDVGITGHVLQMVLTNPYPKESRQTAGNRMAIANIRERLQLHFDAEADMQSGVQDGIYRVTIRMPYLPAGRGAP